MNRILTGAAAMLALSVVGASVSLGGGAADYTVLDEEGEPLRSAFNADVGKVRVLMLVAPT